MSSNTPVVMVSGTQSVQGTSPKQIELSSTVDSQELSTLIVKCSRILKYINDNKKFNLIDT